MKKKYKIMLMVIVPLLAIALSVSMSYAYFTSAVLGNETAQNSAITTGIMALEFTDGDQVTLNNAVPGTSVEKTFKVKNTGNLETTYDLYFSEILNELEDKNDLVYTLSSETGCNVLEDTVVPSVVGEESKITTCNIGVDETHEYTLTIKFIDDNTNQDDNRGKRFSTKISVNEYKEYQRIAKLVSGSDFNNIMESLSGNKITDIKNIIINKEELNNTTDRTLISADDSDYKIYADYSDGIINLYTNQDKVFLNENSSNMFYSTNLESYDFVNYLDTSNVINMSYMFQRAGEGVELKLSNFNASNVTNMRGMFDGAKFTRIDLGANFNASNALDMSYMFENIKATTLNLGDNFNAKSATNMEMMFYNNADTELIDLGDNFNAESDSNVNWMFQRAGKNLKLGKNFNGKNITNMSGMFYYFYGTSLNLGDNFDTSSATNMTQMFSGCSYLDTLNLGNHFDTSNVTDMSFMFSFSVNLKAIYLGNKFYAGSNTKIRRMFDSGSLEKIYVGKNVKFDAQTTDDVFNARYLVGGAGTTFDRNNDGVEYARIDDPDNGKPGYFTLQED